jgi:ATP-dependent Zn protease
MMAEARDTELSEDQWQRYEPRMRRQTRRLIRKHRDKIERVAAALIERKTLEANEIDALIAGPA